MEPLQHRWTPYHKSHRGLAQQTEEKNLLCAPKHLHIDQHIQRHPGSKWSNQNTAQRRWYYKTKSQKIQRHWQPTNPAQGTPYQWKHWRCTVLRRSTTFTPSGLNFNFKFPLHNVNLLLLFIVNKFVTCYMILSYIWYINKICNCV
jgi:hypothetical protein